MVGSSPKGDPVAKRNGEIITRVGVNGLEQSQDDPNVNGQNVQVGSEQTVEKGSTDGAHTEDQDFQWVSVLGGQTKGSRIFVVHLVNVLVERSIVESSVGKVVPSIFKNEKEGDLRNHEFPRRKGNCVGSKTKVLGHWVETPNLTHASQRCCG